MSESTAPPRKLSLLAIVRLLGVTLFVVAFFLPAVNGQQLGDSPLSGLQCAWITIVIATASVTRESGGAASDIVMIVLSAIASPLAATLGVLALLGKAPRARLWLTPLLPICLIAASVFVAHSKMHPLIGHYVWTAGALLMTAPEFARMAGIVAKSHSSAPE
jgi:hypothetical protein